MNKTGISWTDYTLNPLTGCDKISEGCINCYASTVYERHRWSFKPTLRLERLAELRRIPAGSKVFLGSVTDIFHDYFMKHVEKPIEQVFEAITRRPDVVFQILTKRPWNALDFFRQYKIPDNVWLGVSAENKRWLESRTAYLEKIPAKIKFVSCEPLLEDLTTVDMEGRHVSYPLETRHIKWIIVGAESGTGRRPFKNEWALNLKEICDRKHISFWFKQGSDFKPGQHHEIDGRSYMEFPRINYAVKTVKPKKINPKLPGRF